MQEGFCSSVTVSSCRNFPVLPKSPGRGSNVDKFGQCLNKAGLASLTPLQHSPSQGREQQLRSEFYAEEARLAQRDRLAGRKKESAKGHTLKTVPFQPAASTAFARAEAENGPCFLEQGLAKDDLAGFSITANQIPGLEGQETPLLSPETVENVMAQIAEGLGTLNMTAAQELCLQLQPESWGEVLVHCKTQQNTFFVEISTRHPAVQELLADQLAALPQFFLESNPGFEHLKIDVSLSPNKGENAVIPSGEGVTGEESAAKEAQALQQLQHDVDPPALALGENRPKESAAAVLLPGYESQTGTEELFFTETGESKEPAITLQPARQENTPQDESAGGKEAAGKAVAGRNQGAGEQGATGSALQTAIFLPEEMAEQISASFQGFEGASGNPEFQGNLHPFPEKPFPAGLLGKVIPQIVEHMEHSAPFNMPGVQELRLRLQPESLGEVLVRIRRQQGVLSAEIVTRHTAVKEMLESQLETLRQRFQEANLNVEHVDVLLQDEGKSGFTFSRQGSGQDHPGATVAGTGAETAAGESRGLSSEWRGAGGKVDCLV